MTPAKIIHIGSKITDTATGLSGMVTHLHMEMSGDVQYLFQPCGLDPKTGEPVSSTWATAERLPGAEYVACPDLPYQVLGTVVRDEASGFEGVAISLKLHINGCVHLDVQPRGTQANGSPIKPQDFDIRRLSGKAIKQMTAEAKAESEKRNPSPSFCPPLRRSV